MPSHCASHAIFGCIPTKVCTSLVLHKGWRHGIKSIFMVGGKIWAAGIELGDQSRDDGITVGSDRASHAILGAY